MKNFVILLIYLCFGGSEEEHVAEGVRASVFVDKRIGEHNDELNEFDKAIRRAQREHQVSSFSEFLPIVWGQLCFLFGSQENIGK